MTRSAELSAEVEANLNKPMVYLDDEGRAIYRASALGQCTSAFIYVRSGFEAMKPPDSMQRRFDEGHLHEANIIQRLNTEHGIEVFNREREVTLWITPTVGIRGHIDGEGVGTLEDERGLITHPLHHRLVENKTMSSKAYKWWIEASWDERWAKYPGYAKQITVLGEATGLGEVIYAVKDKESGQLLVEVTTTAVVPMPLIKAQVLSIEGHVRQGLPLPEECATRSFPCPVFYVGPCGDEKRETIDERKAEVIEALAHTYHTSKLAEANAKAAKEKARDELKVHLPEGGKFDTPDGWKIAFAKREAKGTEVVESFDMEAFANEHPELVAEFTTTKEVTKWSQERVNVTPPKDGWS